MIVLEGPAKNALGTDLLQHLDRALASAGSEPVLLTGAGDAFSAGLNLKELAGFDGAAMERFLRLLSEVVERLFRHPGPTVAAVNGHAIAGGAILAAACDHRVATTNPGALLSLNEVALGLQFPPGILEMVRYRVARFETVVLGAQMHSPQEALRLGLVDELADDPVAVAKTRMAALAAHPRSAYTAAKESLRARVVTVDAASERAFLERVLPVWTSDELRLRIRTFLDRKR